MRVNLFRAFMASTAIMLGVGVASANTSSNSLKVRLKIVDGCTVNFDRGNDITLGSYSNLNDSIQYVTSFSVRCTASQGAAGTPYEVALDAGMWPKHAGDTRARRLRGVMTGQMIDYQVFQGDLPGKVWGTSKEDIIAGKRAPGATSETMNRHDFVIYVQAQGSPGADEYVDGLRATVTYASGGA